MDLLLTVDKVFFILINRGLNSHDIDAFMVFVSEPRVWSAIALIYCIYAVVRKKWKIFFLFLIIGVIVAFNDYFTYSVLKQFMDRLRPCKTLSLGAIVDGCAGWVGFPSNHATNSMLIVTMVWRLSSQKWFLRGLFFFASLVGFSRVYLGVHYPSDIFFGYLWGGGFGYICSTVIKFFFYKKATIRS